MRRALGLIRTSTAERMEYKIGKGDVICVRTDAGILFLGARRSRRRLRATLRSSSNAIRHRVGQEKARGGRPTSARPQGPGIRPKQRRNTKSIACITMNWLLSSIHTGRHFRLKLFRMAASEDFEDIRPYRDEEVPDVIERTIKNASFERLMNYVYPDEGYADLAKSIESITTVDEFQSRIAYPAMRKVINQTVEQLTVSGLDGLGKEKSRLYISNHRDIILDSAILNVVLFEAGFGTIETAIGNNLLSEELVADLTKLNKNFVVKRNTGAREFYENSMLLSAYIRHTIVDRGQGVWIAQREGRTKDGMDKTQPGLLKMLGMNCENTMRQCFRELKITPVAISYEYDPCDILKIPELKAISREEKYQKGPDEDFNSILTGITGNKGRVHLSVGETLDEELEVMGEFPNQNDKLRILGEIIDKQVFSQYKLWPTNYIALDISEGTHSYSKYYSPKERNAFEKRIADRLREANLKCMPTLYAMFRAWYYEV